MSTQTLTDRIKADAAAEVASIEAEAARTVAAIEAECQTTVAALREEAAAARTKKQAQQTLVATSKAKQAGKLAVQTAKRRHLDTIFAKAYDALVSAEAAQYEALIGGLAKARLPDSIAAVQSVIAPAGRVSETERVLSSLGITASVTGDEQLDAGFVLTTDDGVYDISFARVFADARPALETMVANEFLRTS